jgi:hypothetical protein
MGKSLISLRTERARTIVGQVVALQRPATSQEVKPHKELVNMRVGDVTKRQS